MKQTDTITNFDPEKFLLVAEKRFDDLKIGDIFRAPSRTLTDAHAVAFQSVSADNHPVHYDSVWAARHGHSAPVVHGLQVLAFTAPAQRFFMVVPVAQTKTEMLSQQLSGLLAEAAALEQKLVNIGGSVEAATLDEVLAAVEKLDQTIAPTPRAFESFFQAALVKAQADWTEYLAVTFPGERGIEHDTASSSSGVPTERLGRQARCGSRGKSPGGRSQVSVLRRKHLHECIGRFSRQAGSRGPLPGRPLCRLAP